MWIPSKINVLYLLAVLMSIEQGVTASKLAEATQDLCKNKDRDDFELKLRATLLFRNTLILIDDDWLVYKIPHSNINNSYSQLMIDVLGKPLEEEWPAFKDYPEWKDIKPNVVSIFHVDIKTPVLYMVAKGMLGVFYNLNTSQFYSSGRPDSGGDFVQPCITDNGPTQFMIVMNATNCIFCREKQAIKQAACVHKCMWLGYGNITWFDDGTQGFSYYYPMGYMYYTWNRSTPSLKNITLIDERAPQPSKYISHDFELGNLDWNLPTGFVYEGDFYFFGYKNVYTFPVSPLKLVIYHQNTPVHASNPVKITSVKDYFQCVQLNISGKTFPPEAYTLNPGTASNGIASWIWIVLGGIVLLLVVAISALLVWFFSLGSKSRHSKLKCKTSSEAISKHDQETTATVKQSLAVKDKKK